MNSDPFAQKVSPQMKQFSRFSSSQNIPPGAGHGLSIIGSPTFMDSSLSLQMFSHLVKPPGCLAHWSSKGSTTQIVIECGKCLKIFMYDTGEEDVKRSRVIRCNLGHPYQLKSSTFEPSSMNDGQSLLKMTMCVAWQASVLRIGIVKGFKTRAGYG